MAATAQFRSRSRIYTSRSFLEKESATRHSPDSDFISTRVTGWGRPPFGVCRLHTSSTYVYLLTRRVTCPQNGTSSNFSAPLRTSDPHKSLFHSPCLSDPDLMSTQATAFTKRNQLTPQSLPAAHMRPRSRFHMSLFSQKETCALFRAKFKFRVEQL